MTHSARPLLEFTQSFSVKSRQESFDPDSDGGQSPGPEGSTSHMHASFLLKQEKVALGRRQTDLFYLYLEPSLLNPEASRNFPEATWWRVHTFLKNSHFEELHCFLSKTPHALSLNWAAFAPLRIGVLLTRPLHPHCSRSLCFHEGWLHWKSPC